MDGVKDTALEDIKKKFTDTLGYYKETHERGEKDIKFALGDQWCPKAKANRDLDGRPALTDNQCPQFIEQVVNAAREIRPAVKVAPIDDKGDPDTAEVFKGLVRNTERQSKASIAYDAAVQSAVQAGIGWIRIRTKYTDPMSFTQEPIIDPVLDWKSCMIDPESILLDGSDAEYGFQYIDLDKKSFEAKYPGKEPVSYEDEGWCQGEGDSEKVRIVDAFYKVYEGTTIYECFMIDSTTVVLTEAQYEQVKDTGSIVQVLRQRDTKTHKIKMCKLYGKGILEETEWLGEYIPLIPVYGKMVWVNERKECYSLIHQAKDSQDFNNLMLSVIAEILGNQPKNQPYVGAVGQFATDGRWENAHQQNYATLEYDPVPITDEVTGQSMLAPPPQKSISMQIPPALFQLKADAQMSMKSALGMYDENRGNESNAISGVAIRARQVRGDRSTFHFIDNLAHSIRHVGVILCDLYPKLYDMKIVRRIIGNDGQPKTVQLDPEAKSDKAQGIYNLGAGKYDVDIDVGPSYATQQQEFLDATKEIIRVYPEFAVVAGDKMVESTGIPDADTIVARMKAMNPQMYEDDPQSAQIMALTQRIKAMEDQKMTALAALDDKKRNEAEELNLKSREVAVKEQDEKRKWLETMAKIEEMKQKSEGAAAESLADFAEAIFDMDAENKRTQQILPEVLNKLDQLEAVLANGAASQPQGQPLQG